MKNQTLFFSFTLVATLLYLSGCGKDTVEEPIGELLPEVPVTAADEGEAVEEAVEQEVALVSEPEVVPEPEPVPPPRPHIEFEYTLSDLRLSAAERKVIADEMFEAVGFERGVLRSEQKGIEQALEAYGQEPADTSLLNRSEDRLQYFIDTRAASDASGDLKAVRDNERKIKNQEMLIKMRRLTNQAERDAFKAELEWYKSKERLGEALAILFDLEGLSKLESQLRPDPETSQ